MIFVLIFGISFIVATGFYKLVEYFVKKRLKKRGVEISDSFFQISMFKGLSVTLILFFILVMFLAIAGAIFFRASGDNNESISMPIINILTYGLFILWLTVLYQLYNVAKILKINKVLSIRPSLIIIFTLIAYYAFWWLAIIPFVVIWIKANAYIHHKA